MAYFNMLEVAVWKLATGLSTAQSKKEVVISVLEAMTGQLQSPVPGGGPPTRTLGCAEKGPRGGGENLGSRIREVPKAESMGSMTAI